MSRVVAGVLVVLALVVGVVIGVAGGRMATPQAAVAVGAGSPAAPAALSAPPVGTDPSPAPATPSPSPAITPSPSPRPSPTPVPTPVLVAAPLTGRPVTEAVATRPVIAVMIDDHRDARPQSGLSQASVVWQAPAEGGIPRYMALFQDTDPVSVGPVRSSRLYFIAWAAEWNAVYAHVGGSPQALALLHSADGRGRVVWDADEFRWSRYLYRIKERDAPHNVYSDAKGIRALVKAVGAKAPTFKAAWQFAPDAPSALRPVGGQLVVPYLANVITYDYDRASNTYPRTVSGEGRQVDPATDSRVAPKNVVVMLMSFAPLNDGSTKHRLEAQFTGTGTAWIATNGVTVKGTWKKASMTAPTQLFGPDGQPVTLTMGQTFVQVVPLGTRITVKDGQVPALPAGGR